MKLQMLKDKKIEKLYINSEGSKIRAKIPRIEYFYMLGVIENGNFEQSYRQYGMSDGYEIFDRWDILSLLPEEEKALREIVKAKKSPEGTYDLIVGPEVAGIIAHESCGHPSEADRILGREAAEAGESFINPSKVGEIKESWKGIRVTENMPHIFSNIVEVSKEREKVKWWDEVLPSYLPYILVDGVNITRSKL